MLKAWTREVLGKFVRTDLRDYRFIVVSNREPFQHRRVNGRIECIQPASGMASALDPVMSASGGLWIAHGSGNADKLAVDKYDHVAVPPESPRYTLRRVWLTEEEEAGHYGGLSNQGLWPLCHVAFTRPVFDSDHWRMYRQVNRRFADAILDEAGAEPTFVFIQDYHFGLLPRMLREARSNLVIAQFWHIPWPNREVFSAFPWREELLDGMLGNDLLGFHLPHHCQNFLDTVDSSVEARVDRGGSEIFRGGSVTTVRPYPIGIDFDEHVELANSDEVAREIRNWRESLRLEDKLLGIGIDRCDYTKGIPERLRFLDRLLQHHPEYRNKLVFAQIAVPSRSSLKAYKQIEQEIDSLAAQINLRWGNNNWRPVILMKKHFNITAMTALHRLADFCVVTSLHDGMNLVSKEFVASRVDNDGVLILSQFAGAARELSDALIINPFAVDEGAAAYHCALQMSAEERRRRMTKMRSAVEYNNVYRWAGRFLSDLARVEFPGTSNELAAGVDSLPEPLKGRAVGMAV
jgi:alpha,alpha-trehalose-phosphate synthase [UDP-forming]